MARGDVWVEATEAALVDAWGYLMRLPDRERGWFAGGRVWPEVVRDPVSDYPDYAAPRLPMGRREMALVGKVFLNDDCLRSRLDQSLRPLVALVLAAKARPDRGGRNGW